MMESIKKLRESLKDCTNEAGVEPNRFDTYWITARACDMLIDEIEAEVAERFMELPVDADGVPIKPGDIMQFRDDAPVRVDSIGNSKCYVDDFGWFGGNGGFYGKGTLKCCRHVKPRTLEDVLEEFADMPERIDRIAATKRYADEIRELLRGDAE